MTEQRLDKWLWCARLTKTRSGAARLISAGKVRINGDRTVKPSRLVHAGDVITAAHLGRLTVVRVIDMAERRGPASVAQSLYEDLTPKDVPAPHRPQARAGGRPTKRDRRRLEAFRTAGLS